MKDILKKIFVLFLLVLLPFTACVDSAGDDDDVDLSGTWFFTFYGSISDSSTITIAYLDESSSMILGAVSSGYLDEWILLGAHTNSTFISVYITENLIEETDIISLTSTSISGSTLSGTYTGSGTHSDHSGSFTAIK